MPSTSYQRSSNVDTSRVGERVIVFERATKRAIVLNPTGAQIWLLLETPRTPAELGAALQQQFTAVAAAQIEADVETYLRELRDQNLIVPAVVPA